MNSLLKWLLSQFLFAGTMFLAAGADAMAGLDGGDGGFDDGTDGSDPGADAGGDEQDGGADEAGDSRDDLADRSEDDPSQPTGKVQAPVEEKEVAEFAGLVSKRMLALKKEAPELAAVFAKYPNVQSKVEAVMRRDSAYRECFPTVAEARQMRELFPSGLQDVEVLQQDARELQELDGLFDARGDDGSYPGHKQVIGNMFERDPEAAKAFCKQFPKEWARLDPEGYRDVAGKIVGATLGVMQISDMPVLDFLAEMHDAAKEAGNTGIQNGLAKLWNKLSNFTSNKEAARPTPEQEALARERKQLDAEKSTRTTEDFNRFRENYNTKSMSLTRGIIDKHPAIQALAKVKAITPEVREKILRDIHGKIGAHLKSSPVFMRKLTPAFKGGQLEEALNIQKAAWSNPALLNRIIRHVLQAETPALVRTTRETVQRRAGAPTAARPAAAGEKKPYQVGKNWFKGNGTPFSMEEILQRKHLEA